MSLLGLLDRPTGGRIWLGGAAAGELSDRDRTRLRSRSIGFVFQAFHLVGFARGGHGGGRSVRRAGLRRVRRLHGVVAAGVEASLSGGKRPPVVTRLPTGGRSAATNVPVMAASPQALAAARIHPLSGRLYDTGHDDE